MSDLAAVVGALGGAALGGTGGVVIGRWLGRPQPSATLVAIRRQSDDETVVEVPAELIETSGRFDWAPTLSQVTTIGRLRAIKHIVDEVVEHAPQSKRKAKRLIREIEHASTKKRKLEVLRDLLRDELLSNAIEGALRRQELTLAVSEDQENDEVLQLYEISRGEVPALLLQFPDWGRLFAYEDAFAPEVELEKIKPFITALARFDKDPILRCLEFITSDLDEDYDIASLFQTKLAPLLQGNRWQADVVVTNRGDRLVILNPYGVLLTKPKGGAHALPPLALKILASKEYKKDERGERPTRILTADADYIPVAPQSVVALTCVSENTTPDEPEPAALAAAFDTDLLICSVVLVQEGGRRRKSQLSSPWISFGAAVAEAMKSEVMEIARS